MSVVVSRRHELSRLFSPDSMQLNLRSSDPSGILSELVELVPGISRKDEIKRQLHRALTDRERLSSTALGRGIAVPHTRNNIAAAAGRAVIVFGRHDHGVDFGARDQMPVHLFFLVLAPDINSHLQTLSRLTRLLRDGALREALMAAVSPEDVIGAIREAEMRA
jgi:mannitol/fructose-specific phosphotransferase system IIA component (Ntr-type)